MSEHKNDHSDLFPWENEEGRVRKPNRGDSIPPKTNIQSRVHSKPKVDGQEYLDLYIRTKEKERTEKYGEVLSKRLKNVSESWVGIKKDMFKKEEELPKVPKGGVDLDKSGESNAQPKSTPKKYAHLKTQDWNY